MKHHDILFDPFCSNCPSRSLMAVISGKWVGLVVMALADEPLRFSRLRQKVQGISQKMLTQSLRQLEEHGFVSRTIEPTVPISVTYSLTPLGKSLNRQIQSLQGWAEEHYESIRDFKEQYVTAAKR